MITLLNLRWSNWFSYGEDNYIDFQKSNLTQILGKNGSGKTSVIHIIEEVLFNKNSKGVKKADIMNRDAKFLSATLEFNVDNTAYMVKLDRKSSAKVSLINLTDDEDISSHTATNTFKDIQKTIGMEFATFTQLVYQNSKQGLEFLTSADSARKKFLISLFNLDKYTEYYDIFKKAYNETNLTVKEYEGKKSVLQRWLNDHKDMDFTIKEILQEPNDEVVLTNMARITDLNSKLNNIEAENANIVKNNRARSHFESLKEPEDLVALPIKDDSLMGNKLSLNQRITEDNKLIRELERLGDSECKTCHQPVDTEIKDRMLSEAKTRIETCNEGIALIDDKLKLYNDLVSEYKNLKNTFDLYEVAKKSFDTSIPTKLLSYSSIKEEIDSLEVEVCALKQKKSYIIKQNREASAHNVKVETILTEIDKNTKELKKVDTLLNEVNSSKTKLDILKTVFSTKGLVSYKIDFLIKDLQNKINEYLVVLSDGRFQLNFILKSDSINIGIIDNGKEVDISALSTGELSRVNVSTLLAIRALMSTLSNTKINLLFLDEIMGVLDEQGKANLIDILLGEKDLNTYIVSHEYTHPLLDKIYISKNKEGSSIGK
ncbi:MAG: hypothetical protein GY707_05270 [Desulfobacteraceae bacterium]|nr:hypothetical protein [Desulfobacteraceae bacterium]